MAGNVGHKWKKGQSGNPKGRPPVLPPEVLRERKENQVALIRLIATYTSLTQEEAQRRMAQPNVPQIAEMVQGMINKAKEGDVGCFKFLMEVMIGKIPEMTPDEELDQEDIEILARVKQIKEQKKIK